MHSDHPAHILIVDDTPTNLEVLLHILDQDYDVSIATSGDQALGLLKQGALPELILLDVMMPGLDGYQVCERIKADPATREIPVIFVTARTDADSESRALESGGVDFIHKPINAAVVRARVRLQLALRRRTEELEWRLAEISHYVAVKLNITERKETHERLAYMANHDVLTGLPNRVLFFERLDQALALAHRRGTRLALLFVDLDRFKPVNDTWGHAVGDQLLQAVAQRLIERVRASDTVGRIGGDELVILLNEITSADDAARVAEELRHSLAQPFTLAGLTLGISASIGVARYPDHGQDAITLARHADEGMYLAKQAGGDRVQLFSG